MFYNSVFMEQDNIYVELIFSILSIARYSFYLDIIMGRWLKIRFILSGAIVSTTVAIGRMRRGATRVIVTYAPTVTQRTAIDR